jgi:hypothetical protein
MQLWSPPHDAPHLLEWWRPLMLASQRARSGRVPWPIHLDEFRLSGRVLRSGRPDVWIYEHHANGRALCIDAAGTTYRFVPTPRAKGAGQFRPCDIRTAVWRARLPDVVKPVWYEEPRRYCGAAGDAAVDAGADPHGAGIGPERRDAGDRVDLREVAGGVVPLVSRRHLSLVRGGRS